MTSSGVCLEHHLLPFLPRPFVGYETVSNTVGPRTVFRVDGCGGTNERELGELAQLLDAFGITANFFLLPPGSYGRTPGELETSNYFGHWAGEKLLPSRSLLPLLDDIQSAGHSVGLHNDVVALSLKTGFRPGQILMQALDAMRAGLPSVRVSASHGSPLARQLAFNNREIFMDFRRKDREYGRLVVYNGNRVSLNSIRMQDFGLYFEAYEPKRTARISDAGGRWSGRGPAGRLQTEEVDEKEMALRVSTFIASNSEKDLHLLIHPRYWRWMI